MRTILGYFPERVGTLIEPFGGSAALALAAPTGFGRLRHPRLLSGLVVVELQIEETRRARQPLRFHCVCGAWRRHRLRSTEGAGPKALSLKETMNR